MKYRRLGKTDLNVSVVCQGGWSIVGDWTWGPQDKDDAVAAIRAAIDAGINFFDTAESYGNGESEVLFGRELDACRKDVVIASKVGPDSLSPALLREHCESSLRRLNTDYIDLYQIHWPSPTTPIADTLGAMEELRREGKIRHLGVSNFGTDYLGDVLAAGRVESNQLAYSLLFRSIEYAIQPLCADNDVGILCYSPLCQGLLTGKYRSPDEVSPTLARTRIFDSRRPNCRHHGRGCEKEAFKAIEQIREICRGLGAPMGVVSLAWLLAQRGVTSVLAGGRTAAQVRQNAQAAELELPDADVKALSDATKMVKEILADNADMWQDDSRLEKPSR